MNECTLLELCCRLRVGDDSLRGVMRVRRILMVVAIAVWGVVPVPASGEDTSGQGTSATLCDQVSVSQFSDVGAGRYAADYILCMRALGLSVGTASGAYNPESDLTRAQMATFLVRLWRDVLGMGCPEGVEAPFVDTAGNPHESSIGCLYGLGITAGTTAVAYGPSQTLTGSQISRFLARSYEKAGKSCGPAGKELDRAVECLAALKVIPSEAEGADAGAVTRDQMAVYLIGLWHNLAGRGLPPSPPHKPDRDPTASGETVAVARRSQDEDGEEDDEDEDDDGSLDALTTTRTTVGSQTTTGSTVPDDTPFTDNDGFDTPFTDNDGTDSDGFDTHEGGSTIGTRATTATTVSVSSTTGSTVPDITPYSDDSDDSDSD